MADSSEWFVSEDGCLSLGIPSESVTYHPNLNAILVTTKEPAVRVLDVTSGSLLQTSNLSAGDVEHINLQYLPNQDRILFSSRTAVSVRKDLNGILLLDTALQVPVHRTEDVVTVELPLPEAYQLLKCLMSAELTGVDYVEDVLRELEKDVLRAQQVAKVNHKVAKWASVKLTLPHCAIKTVCSGLVQELKLQELKRLHQNVPGLSVASAVVDRLNYLLSSGAAGSNQGIEVGTPVEKSLMYSEAARLETFIKWPHMDYKWALPEPMAQAGFYHQPSSTGDDRAMCFTCNVCLVCWEPTDEPWSEHERHSPNCPFVKGEFTQNVPMSVTYATEPGHSHGESSGQIECVSTTSSKDLLATSGLHGDIVLWNMSKRMTVEMEFNIDPWDPAIASVIGTHWTAYSDGSIKPSVSTDLHKTDARNSAKPVVKESVPEAESQSHGKAELIEVGGAWKSQAEMDVIGDIVEIPLTSHVTSDNGFEHQRCRPSQDIYVSSLCVLNNPTVSKSSSKASSSKADSNKHCCSLIAGVTIRKHALPVPGGIRRTLGEGGMQSEVEALNEVNHALSSGESTPQIIDSTSQSSSPAHFQPYLLVHDISPTAAKQQAENKSLWKNSGSKVKDVNYSAQTNKSKALQDIFMSPMIIDEDEDDDDDCKIIGVSHVDDDLGNPPSAKFSAIPSKSLGPIVSVDLGASEVGESSQNEPSPPSQDIMNNAGKVMQCLELPSQVSASQFVSHITPTLDGHHVIVITSPYCVSPTLTAHCGGLTESSFEDAHLQTACAGTIIIYKVSTSSGHVMLDPEPLLVHTIPEVSDCVRSLSLLPLELGHTPEEEELHAVGVADGKEKTPDGQMVVTTYKGSITVLDLCSLKRRCIIEPPSKDVYISSVYCSGIDRLCCLSQEGRLQFYMLASRSWQLDEDHVDSGASKKPSVSSLPGDDPSDMTSTSSEVKADELLVQQSPLTTDSLTRLHDLTQFESVVPRFSATVPPCWSEIQQEQQQRRHPQHLHQQGDATQTTRTWRLQPDSSSWEEHMFELVLPRSCSIGHVDLKFTLHPLCTTSPNIQITLLRQSISSLGRGIPPLLASPDAADADIKMEQDLGYATEAGGTDPKASEEDIICGPVDISNYVDLSGHGGIVTLTSAHLLKYKARSFLLHMKAVNDKPTSDVKAQNQSTSADKSASDKTPVSSVSGLTSTTSAKSITDPITSQAGVGTSSTASSTKQKLENVRGCDWLQELSVTVRQCKKTTLHRERWQRVAMLQWPSFHAQLVRIACGTEEGSEGVTREHRQRLALSILIWVLAIQSNSPHAKLEEGCLLSTLQSNLKPLVRACFMESGRTTAHQCAKLLIISIEFTKTFSDADVAPSFSLSLLHALLDSLADVGVVQSSGALHWYFTLLNRVKCMDTEMTSQRCADVLVQVASSYHSRHSPHHALLRARYGLYGTPLEPELFDIDLPVTTVPSSSTQVTSAPATSAKPPPGSNSQQYSLLFGGNPAASSWDTNQLPMSYANVVASAQPSNNSQAPSAGADSTDFSDLIGLVSGDKGRKLGGDGGVCRNLHGLLEVEPLHFTCHATSDGTRMERLDTVSQGTSSHVSSSAVPPPPAGESLSSAAGAALASLSTAMASTENQLSSLQQKQMQILKLQQQKYKLEQKLAETSKSAASASTSANPAVMFYSSELMPPTPKNTPFFMTPPMTPPNEAAFHNMLVQGTDSDPGKPSTGKGSPTKSGDETPVGLPKHKGGVVWPYSHQLFHPPAAQALVIERMHAGARRFVVLDFQHPVLLTDIIIPACADLASISIDIWVSGEEVDGQRLVVSSDIGMRSLFMNDIMPPPVCRFLKITTIGRYGGSTTRSKIPIGSFFGHTFMLPWEMPAVAAASSASSPAEGGSHLAIDQSAIFSQLSCYVSLLEDIECRYSLACNRLVTLLESHQEGASSQPVYTNRRGAGKHHDITRSVYHAYSDCAQLQLQYNLAHKAIERLHKVLGLHQKLSGPVNLKKVPTDKLRVLSELLLDTLLSMTVSSPSIPQLPVSMYTILTPQACQVLFSHLCISGGTRRSQLHTGVLLARVCGQQAWWGDFLGNILQEFFSSDQELVFPRDRVFVLITALGQKALCGGSSAGEVLEAVLMLLARLLAPLLSPAFSQMGSRPRTAASLDLSLISWLLLFLSKCLDTLQPVSDEADKARDKDGASTSRWDFLQGESALQNSRTTKSAVASKLYRRKLQKRLMHHKQQLLDLQMAKKKFLLSQAEKAALAASGGSKEVTEQVMKTQEMMFKKQFKQFSSKHFKDLINIRRTDGELLKKSPKENGGSANGASDGGDGSSTNGDSDGVVVPREKCIPVVRGLMALLLSMDFTCHVDLFIIACKVMARISGLARPCVGLWEVMGQEELEHLVLLTCNTQYNHGNVNWGGAWAPHAIICLLQDILDGEKMYSTLAAEAMDEDSEQVPTVAMETDETLQGQAEATSKIPEDVLMKDQPLPSTSNSIGAAPPTSASSTATGGTGFPFDKESSLMVDMLLGDEYFDEGPPNAKLQEFVGGEGAAPFSTNTVGDKSGPWYWVPPQPPAPPAGGSSLIWASSNSTGMDSKKLNFKAWKSKLHSYVGSKSGSSVPQGVSTAMDARLENGVELTAELRLRVMMSLEEESIQTALASPLPPLLPGIGPLPQHSLYPSTDDEQLSDANLFQSSTFTSQQAVPSSQMLSTCFNQLFMQLERGRVCLDSLLHAWLTLSEEPSSEETSAASSNAPSSSHSTFDATMVPNIPLSPVAVTALLNTLAHGHIVNMGSWVVAFQTLALLCNQRCGDERWLAAVMVSSESLMLALNKFLSIVPQQGSAPISHHFTQIGPTAVKAFYEFLVRMQLRCAEDNENHWKELLLRLIYTLTADRGAFSCSQGPLDAQCKLLEYMLDQSYDTVDVNNAISVVEVVVGLVRHYITTQDHMVCRSLTDSSMSARSCFGGLLANILRGGDNSNTSQATRDLLMCNLLKLVNLMVQIPMPSSRSSATSASGLNAVEIDPALASQSRTDEQKQESAASNTSGKNQRMMIKCTHTNTREATRKTTLCDIILGHATIMKQLLESLSWCSSNTMAMILGSSGLPLTQDSAPVDPLSVGDGIFQILCTLNRLATDISLALKPVYTYLASEPHQGIRMMGICRLSEPLLWFILRVLDCDVANKTFLDMGGVSVVCNNLVQSNHQLINTSPSLVTTIMQYLMAVKPPTHASSSNSKKLNNDTNENADGMQNFAPIGTITSSSPTAGPADVLIQASPPHRRARSAAWSYHFYPDEAWVDLSVALPCAVLLKEVHIQPHLTSLATCPAAVCIEVSHDQSPAVPVSAPVLTSGLSSIKIHLLKPEIVTTVTLRFHKPRDSQTLGLSQISLLGFTAFGDTSAHKSSSWLAPQEDYVSRTSIGWLRLLHHCLSQNEALQSAVAQAASFTPHLLPTCTSLLLSPSATLYATNIEAVLLKIGLHSMRMGLSLIDQILRNASASPEDEPGSALPQHGKLCGVANESTIDILYQLGLHQDVATHARMKALTDWLGDSARVALQKTNRKPQESYRLLPWQQNSTDLPSPAPAHVHCVAAALWKSHELPPSYSMTDIITKDLLSSMYEWSILLPVGSALKQAVDYVICSICYIHPEYFSTLLEWMGIVVNVDITSVTDDYKDSHQMSMTDDSKADSEARSRQPVNMEGISGSFTPFVLQDLDHMMLDEAHLSLLAVACQSPEALRQLLDSGFVAVLCQGIYEFSMREIIRYNESMFPGDVSASKSATSLSGESNRRARTNSESSQTDKSLLVTVDLVAPVLLFLADVAQETEMKRWLAGPEGSAFWPVLLRLLCGTPPHSLTAVHSLHSSPGQHKVMTSPQRSAIETATVKFFSAVLSCNPQSQTQFATMLCDVIRGNGSVVNSQMLNTSPLSGFMRRLFLQVLLEDEKILVSFSSSAPVYKGTVTSMNPNSQHPRCGAGHKFRCMLMSMQTTCGEALSYVSDTPVLSVQLSDNSDDKANKDDKKDTTQLGLEVAEQISAVAGLTAKEKREKGKPPLVRPPTRRGIRQPDPSSAIQLPSMGLFHPLLPGQPLPSDLTLSQLLVLLHQRGFPVGQASLEFNMQLTNKGKSIPENEESEPDIEAIPVEILMETPSFNSALQVFAGVGGLALLAEHLPLLYPEVTRQVTPSDPSEKNLVMGGGYEWVIESAEDIYEDLDDPMPPGPQVKQQSLSPVVPSIPPHSLVAFGLFLRLPGYAEVLLREKRQAQCLLRLVLGVTHDGDGGHILSAPRASSLQTLPFTVLKTLYDSTPLSTDDGVLLRRMSLEIGIVHLILACLSVLSHHAPRQPIPGFHQEIIQSATQAASALSGRGAANGNASLSGKQGGADEKLPVVSQPLQPQSQQHYWAKGTGFGTGSTTSSWDAEQALLRQRSEEQHVTCLLEVLASYINPGDEAHIDHIGVTEESSNLPNMLPELLSQSCLVPAISSYLRNDSVLDMARHVPLYRALLELLRGLAACWSLVPLLLPLKDSASSSSDPPTSVCLLLDKMRSCVDTYASRLKGQQKPRNGSNNTAKADDEESEGLALLIPDIQRTDGMVDAAVERLKQHTEDSEEDQHTGHLEAICRMNHSQEERYMAIMKKLQFDTYELVREDDNGCLAFNVPHHYESQVKAVGDINNAARARRLAQEAVTLSTSLPLSPSSSVFVRCDEERLDLMKVLITGPSDTPYANGCFEFDVYFPPDYPNSPPLINLQTTGNQTVRFNPNLYNDGKVCLSILNTWHGRPEEKWNSQTSSFLQVLVSIQSLILVSEPYFNEPGYERSRGTRAGNASSKEYDAIIRHATVKWAMLEMIRNPVPCFKEVIERHFWLKRHEIMAEVEAWILDLEANSNDKRVGRTISHSCVALKRYYKQLSEEFAKMKPPADIAADDDDTVPVARESSSSPKPSTSSASAAAAEETMSESKISAAQEASSSVSSQSKHDSTHTKADSSHIKLDSSHIKPGSSHSAQVPVPLQFFTLSKLPPIDTSNYSVQLMSLSSSETSGSSSEEQPFDSSEDQGALSSAAEDMVVAIVEDSDENLPKPNPKS